MTDFNRPGRDARPISADDEQWLAVRRRAVECEYPPRNPEQKYRRWSRLVGFWGMLPLQLLLFAAAINDRGNPSGLLVALVFGSVLAVGGICLGSIGGWCVAFLWNRAFPKASAPPKGFVVVVVLFLDLCLIGLTVFLLLLN